MKPTKAPDPGTEATVTGREGSCTCCGRHVLLCSCHAVPGRTPGSVRMLDDAQYKEWKRQRHGKVTRSNT